MLRQVGDPVAPTFSILCTGGWGCFMFDAYCEHDMYISLAIVTTASDPDLALAHWKTSLLQTRTWFLLKGTS